MMAASIITPVILQLLEIPPAMNALQGVLMELKDCAFPRQRLAVAHGALAKAYVTIPFSASTPDIRLMDGAILVSEQLAKS